MIKCSIKKIGKTFDGWRDIIGFIFSILGTLFVTLSMGQIPCRGSTTCGGITYNFAYIIHPLVFKLGLILIVFGFIFQLFDSLITKHNRDYQTSFYFCFFTILIIVLIIMFL